MNTSRIAILLSVFLAGTVPLSAQTVTIPLTISTAQHNALQARVDEINAERLAAFTAAKELVDAQNAQRAKNPSATLIPDPPAPVEVTVQSLILERLNLPQEVERDQVKNACTPTNRAKLAAAGLPAAKIAAICEVK